MFEPLLDFSNQIALLAVEGDGAESTLPFFGKFIDFLSIYWRFCLLHFLNFAIWGAWFVVLGNMLAARGFSRLSIGRIYGVIPIGSMVTPLIIGPIADNFVNTEVLIGISHLVGAFLLFALARIHEPKLFYIVALLYAFAYTPTLGLVNSIIFNNDKELFGGEAGEYFPWVRVFGTLGWIVAGLSHTVILKKGEPVNERPILMAAGLSVVLGLFAFTLPATLPTNAKETADTAKTDISESVSGDAKPIATESNEGDAIELPVANSKTPEPSFFARLQQTFANSIQMVFDNPIFFSVTFVGAVSMGLYFAFAALYVEKSGVPAAVVGPVMTIGQWIEIFFLLSLPWFLGPKLIRMDLILLIGLSAWALRFGLFAIGRPFTLVIIGVAIHGICFDFFFGAGFLNVDTIAPKGLTATAQQLYGFLVYGLGMFVGSEASGWLNRKLTSSQANDAQTDSTQDSTNDVSLAQGAENQQTNWRVFWAVPFVLVTISTILFAFSNSKSISEGIASFGAEDKDDSTPVVVPQTNNEETPSGE